MTARISGAQNAYISSVQPAQPGQPEESLDRWRMLTGVDFPEPGCWQISADYLGSKLTFVIESAADHPQNRGKSGLGDDL